MTAYDRSKAAMQARALAGRLRDDAAECADDDAVRMTAGVVRALAALLDVLAEAVEDGDGEAA